MLLLLPPSETKRSGGRADAGLNLSTLGFPTLAARRARALEALAVLADDPAAMRIVLGLSLTQVTEVERNITILDAPVLAAVERYTGVLYDALGAATLSTAARALAHRSVVIHSALFGLLRADDQIPAYRLSHDSRLPGLPLRTHWSAAIASELAAHPGLILDLRSEAYAALGPAPEHAYFLRVVSPGPDGIIRAMNHFNKKGKGQFLRAVLEAGVDHPDVGSLLEWAAAEAIPLIRGRAGELELTVEPVAAKR